jgi:uncharacterized protein YciI
MKTVYALIWRSSAGSEAFQARIPALMEWLKDLKAKGQLLACGGGGFEVDDGGLTILNVNGHEEALEIMNTYPMNDIGTMELLVWDVFYADLTVKENEHKLRSS